MPHVILRLYPDRTEEIKNHLAEAIVKDVAEITKCEKKSVSVSIVEIDPKDWVAKVHKPDIMGNKNACIIKPGYNPFE